MAKNPFMSAWLSAANRTANTARGQATAAGKANAKRTQKDMMSAWVDMWTPPGLKSSSSRKKTGSTTRRKKS